MFLSVGDTLELPYALDGTILAGCAHLQVATGQATTVDGSLHVEVIAQLAGQSTTVAAFDQPIVVVTPYQIRSTQITGSVDADLQLARIDPVPGDQLVVRATVNAMTDPTRMFVFVDLP